MQRDLIFDLGLHKGEDTEFYLKKGFRVVAVDANADLCDLVANKLSDDVEAGRLKIVSKAIADKVGPITFYENVGGASFWGTCAPDWAARNLRLETQSVEHTVQGITLGRLIEEFGVPYYLKIDIEGLDTVALEGLREIRDRPAYVSIESDKVSFAALRKEFEMLVEFGYDRFKIVPQHLVHKQRPPKPALEGRDVGYTFLHGSSGLFGRDLPGTWLTVDEAIEAYRLVFLRYAVMGDEGYLRGRWSKAVARRLGLAAGWHDTHARHSSVKY